jgi:glucose/arabinose dehydrogenase
VPAGFEIKVFARGLIGPLFVSGPDGMIYVTMPSMGWVTCATTTATARWAGRPRDQDLDRPHGVAFHDGKLYVAGTQKSGASRYLPRAGNRRGKSPRSSAICPTAATSRERSCSAPTASFACPWAHLATSAREKDARRARIVRPNPDGSGEEIFASGSGIRSGSPGTRHQGALGDGQRRDWLGDDSPPAEINIIPPGRTTAGPTASPTACPIPDFGTPEIYQKTEPPAVKLQRIPRPLGLAFYRQAIPHSIGRPLRRAARLGTGAKDRL